MLSDAAISSSLRQHDIRKSRKQKAPHQESHTDVPPSVLQPPPGATSNAQKNKSSTGAQQQRVNAMTVPEALVLEPMLHPVLEAQRFGLVHTFGSHAAALLSKQYPATSTIMLTMFLLILIGVVGVIFFADSGLTGETHEHVLSKGGYEFVAPSSTPSLYTEQCDKFPAPPGDKFPAPPGEVMTPANVTRYRPIASPRHGEFGPVSQVPQVPAKEGSRFPLSRFNVNAAGSANTKAHLKQIEASRSGGTWIKTYRMADHGGKEALELLFLCNIIPMEEFADSPVSQEHIDECIWISTQMLRQKSLEQWVENWPQATRTFEESVTACFAARKDVIASLYGTSPPGSPTVSEKVLVDCRTPARASPGLGSASPPPDQPEHFSRTVPRVPQSQEDLGAPRGHDRSSADRPSVVAQCRELMQATPPRVSRSKPSGPDRDLLY
jgi:hypothetical protein